MIKTLRSLVASLFLLLAPAAPYVAVPVAGVTIVGCAALAPDADPVVVRSEQTIALSFETVNKFVTLEKANRAVLPPSVVEAAKTLRVDFPPAHRAALKALAAYKKNRTAADGDVLKKLITNLSDLQAIATEAAAQIATPKP